MYAISSYELYTTSAKFMAARKRKAIDESFLTHDRSRTAHERQQLENESSACRGQSCRPRGPPVNGPASDRAPDRVRPNPSWSSFSFQGRCPPRAWRLAPLLGRSAHQTPKRRHHNTSTRRSSTHPRTTYPDDAPRAAARSLARISLIPWAGGPRLADPRRVPLNGVGRGDVTGARGGDRTSACRMAS